MPVDIVNRQNVIHVTDELRTSVSKAVRDTLIRTRGGGGYEVSIAFVNDREIAALNEHYRGIPGPTDVLSFPMEDPEELALDVDPCSEVEPPPDGANIEVPEDIVIPCEELQSGLESYMLGDVVISLERAQLQAAQYGHSLMREVCFLTVHGVLHLVGYDHMQPEEEQIMRTLEEEILFGMGLPR